MRNIILLLAFLLSINILYSQDTEWTKYDLDSIISLDMPGDVFEMDSIINGIKMLQIFSRSENLAFVAQRALLEKNTKNGNLSRLPYDLKSLKEEYKGIMNGMIESIPYEYESKELIKKNGFTGYRLRFKNSMNDSIFEVEIYILNRYAYSFLFSGSKNLHENEKKLFFESIVINPNREVSQYLGKSKGYRVGYVFGKYFFYILLIAGIIYFVVRSKK